MSKRKTKSQKVNDKAKRLKQKEKALRRAGAMVRATGDRVMESAEQVEQVVATAEADGWHNGMHTAINIASEARTIGAARKALQDRLDAGR